MYILEKSLVKAEDILYPIMDVGAVELVLTLFFLKAVVNLFLYVVKFKFCDARPGNDQLCTKTLLLLNNYILVLLYVGAALLYFYFTYRAVSEVSVSYVLKSHVKLFEFFSVFRPVDRMP